MTLAGLLALVRRVTPAPLCVCGHADAAHEHYRPGTECGACGAGCPRYRPADLAAVYRDDQAINAVLADDIDRALQITDDPEFVGLLVALADTRRPR